MGNINKITGLCKNNSPISILLVVMCLFFLATSYFNFTSQAKSYVKWSSPDETANYTFAKLYAEEGRLEIPERYNLLVKDIMHPRSFRVFDGVLKPMSFLGIIMLYGTIAHFFGTAIIPFLTPLFGSLGILFFYLLTKELFNQKVGLTAALILAIFPTYFYYTSKSMFHNILFLVLLVAGLFFAIKGAKKPSANHPFKSLKADWPKIIHFSLGSILLGWAVATRTSELLWLAPTLVILYVLNWRRLAFWQLILMASVALITLMPVMYQNILLYGGPFTSGYAEVNTSLNTLSVSGSSIVKQLSLFDLKNLGMASRNALKTVFYFGFKPLAALKLFWKYTLAISPWLIYGSLIGLALWLVDFKKIRFRQVQLLLIFVFISAVLITYYGSWDFHDNPDKNAITIGNSYTRYWLPIYLCMIVWLALALEKLSRISKSRLMPWTVKIFFIFLFSLSSWSLVFGAGAESLSTNIAKGKASRQQLEQVLKMTEHNSVIITKYQDKLFFPERKVVYGLFDDDGMLQQYAILTRYLPTYFYNFTFSSNDLNYLNKRRLKPLGFSLKPLKSFHEFTLYKLAPTQTK